MHEFYQTFRAVNTFRSRRRPTRYVEPENTSKAVIQVDSTLIIFGPNLYWSALTSRSDFQNSTVEIVTLVDNAEFSCDYNKVI